jgi:hypothetical protein
MMRWALVVALGVDCIASFGCTTLSLERHTLDQGVSAGDIRYQEILDNLAMVARDHSALPAYSTMYAGTVSVSDSGSLTSTTAWQRLLGKGAQNGFASQGLNPQLSRTVLQNWSLDPILGPERLEAIRAMLRWSIYGRETLTAREIGLLASPDQDPSPGRHFGVLDQMEKLPVGSVRCGCLADVPACAVHKSHSGAKWVWVLPEDEGALSRLLLAVENVARVNSNSLVLFAIPTNPGAFTFTTNSQTAPAGEPAFSVTATVAVSPGLHLAPDGHYFPWRLDNTGSDAALRSQVNAAGIAP